MARKIRELTLAALLLLALAVRIPAVLQTPATAEHAGRTVAAAVAWTASPRARGTDEVIGATEPPAAIALARGLFEIGLALSPAGGFPSDRYALKVAFEAGSEAPARWARGLWVALDVAIVGLSYAVARRGIGSLWPAGGAAALVAPFLLALSPVMLWGPVRPDGVAPATLCVLAAVLLAARPGPDDRVRWAVVGGLTGLAASAVHLALLFSLLPVAAAARHRGGALTQRLALAVVGLATGAILGDPRLLQNPGIVLSGFAGSALGPAPMGRVWPGATIVRSLTPVTALAAAVAVVAIARSRRPRTWHLVWSLPPLAAGLALPGVGNAGTRLLVPIVALLGAAGLARLSIAARWRRAASAMAVALVAWMGSLAAFALAHVERGDSREAAGRWMLDHLPDDARIVSDFYGPEPAGGRWVTFLLPFDARGRPIYDAAYQLGWYEGFDTFVFVSTQVDRYLRAPSRYERQLRFHDSVRRHGRRLARFDASDYLGPTIEIVRWTGMPHGEGLEALCGRDPLAPAVPDFYLSLGGAYQQMGRTADALRLFEAARRLSPEDSRVALYLGTAYMEAGDEMRAGEILRDAVHRDPRNARLRYQFGLLKQRRRSFGEAIGEYKMAIRYDPSFAEAHYNLGLCYLSVENEGGARASFRKVVQLAPGGELGREAERMLAELGER
jgi:tetratricopeptide (TPR) repeat protein